ncbi:Hypothetical predicted protein [Olea europaea subsp. europaea]|uniref:Uncharacterized protein n=1 Tax=Olea europaea subsp. europaea TaxID=158383 RepID=A0A8S0SIE5_OLEEU|nr:Hypothetical predicted protein [Olea europaea subsp. europaea]
MASWSAKNATEAFLRTLKMGKRRMEPNTVEFIAALAAGNNAQLMVMACAATAGSATLSLVAAAHQTGGRAVCILRGLNELDASRKTLDRYADLVEFAIGDAWILLQNHYKFADFVIVDCKMDEYKAVLVAAQEGMNKKGGLIVGYNALNCSGLWWGNLSLKPHFLPIGEGLMVIKIPENEKVKKKSHWVIEVDKCTGEEHVYRITSPKTN